MAEHENKKQIQITIVVLGVPVVIDCNVREPLEAAVHQALAKTNNASKPFSEWELRDAAGTQLDIKKKIEDFNFPESIKLFLNLKVGAGGNERTSC